MITPVLPWTRMLLPFAWLAGALCPAGVDAETVGHVPAAVQQQILASPGTAVTGAPKASVQIVEYFDYNCSFCRKLAPQLTQLQAGSPDVSITYKEWPIFGGISVYAAKSALAAQLQGRYVAAHDALISAPRLTQESQVDQILQRAGIDLPRLKQDLQAHASEISALLSRSDAEASALGLRGTPGLLVGRNIEMNNASLADLQTAVARAKLF
jgi:protein-disulfide isomerase